MSNESLVMIRDDPGWPRVTPMNTKVWLICPWGGFIKFDQVPLVFDLAEFELA